MPVEELTEKENELKDDQTDIDPIEEDETETMKEDLGDADSDDAESLPLKTPSPKKGKRDRRAKTRPTRSAK